MTRILLLAALIALSACAHRPCTMDQWMVDPTCQ
jgi:hypothetical protein